MHVKLKIGRCFDIGICRNHMLLSCPLQPSTTSFLFGGLVCTMDKMMINGENIATVNFRIYTAVFQLLNPVFIFTNLVIIDRTKIFFSSLTITFNDLQFLCGTNNTHIFHSGASIWISVHRTKHTFWSQSSIIMIWVSSPYINRGESLIWKTKILFFLTAASICILADSSSLNWSNNRPSEISLAIWSNIMVCGNSHHTSFRSIDGTSGVPNASDAINKMRSFGNCCDWRQFSSKSVCDTNATYNKESAKLSVTINWSWTLWNLWLYSFFMINFFWHF